ncbi:MAG TPA: peroxiredoxin-like family protein [Thermoleophilaceae bacterium]|jgi:peroxiredoxin
MDSLRVGDPFPDLALESTHGQVRLSDRWTGGPLVVVFMRHFGCAFCREHLILLAEAHEDIRAAGGDVAAIFQYRAEPTYNFCRSRGVPFECLGDPARAGYRAAGLGRGPRKEYMSLKVYKHWFRANKVGARVGKPSGDVAQRPGTFVVDPNGTIVFAHYNKDSADNPSTSAVIEAVATAAPVRPSFD